ncbi:MarR family winged helix-turn-helix transcriptional regulator [Granulosicoccus antarcticus]|uniref:HTH marR-type domain-containing protein n=1 Tax=Granulosicoccus antarcticus IMCC3135 TaxID=1192854 RepID=A0A2Z2NRH2_9GAMM|nr:MarR family transcriptional regulator [Granulosicoccus antarcticus]ASJ73105.1 hypothetical protein IMCC3135_15105 [Granulosicoccus antarcticus IMCC3135]
MVDTKNSATESSRKKREEQLRISVELMFFGYRAFTIGPDALLAKQGLGRVHHRILYFVGREPSLSVAQLLAVLSVSKQALNAPLRDLMSAGLVASEPCGEDKRVRRLSLTSTGESLEAQLTGIQLDLMAGIFDEAGAGAEAHWQEIMQKMRATL